METYNITISVNPRSMTQKETVIVSGLTLEEARQWLLDRFNAFAGMYGHKKRFATWKEATAWDEETEDIQAYTTRNDETRWFSVENFELEIRRDRDEQ